MEMQLRPYQAAAKDKILKQWDEGYKRTLLVLPTGCGKTVVFASVAENQVEKGHRVLVMAHRGELLDQAADKIKRVTGLNVAFEKAEESSLGSRLPITVGSVQSLCQQRRLNNFPRDYFSDIIVDEAHHCLSDSYKRVLEHFDDANVLGVTATPDRGDRRNLGKYFDSLAYEYNMLDAVREGYLCPIKAKMIPLQIDISNVGITNGDYAVGGIGKALEPYMEQIAQEMAVECKGRKTVVFLPLISTSQRFCDMLNDIGLNAVEVNGMSDDRAQVLEDFASGKYDVLCNSMLLTEGWDCPSVDCIVVLRPTQSRALYQQMVGRGMRTAPGKKDLLLLDFLWMTGRHSLMQSSSLVCKNDKQQEKTDEIIARSAAGVSLIDAAEQADRDILAERENALASQLEEMRNQKRKEVDPLQYSLSIGAEDLADYVPTFAWEMEPATQKQIELLRNRGLNADSLPNKGYACELIKRVIDRQKAGLSTPRQIKLLERYGFERVGEWQFDTASKVITYLSDNRWKLPRNFNPENYKPQLTVGGVV